MKALVLGLLLTVGCFGQDVILSQLCNSVSITVVDKNISKTVSVFDIQMAATVYENGALNLHNEQMDGNLTHTATYQNEKTEEYIYLFTDDTGASVYFDQYFGAASVQVHRDGILYIIDYLCVRGKL